MRMGIGTTHQRAFVLEDLYIPNKILRAKFRGLFRPGSENIFDGGQPQLRQRQIMARRKAYYPAKAAL